MIFSENKTGLISDVFSSTYLAKPWSFAANTGKGKRAQTRSVESGTIVQDILF